MTDIELQAISAQSYHAATYAYARDAHDDFCDKSLWWETHKFTEWAISDQREAARVSASTRQLMGIEP